MTCLEALFPLVTQGGLVIIDDYYTWDGCAKAVHDYLSSIKSACRIRQFMNDVAYITKTEAGSAADDPPSGSSTGRSPTARPGEQAPAA